MNIAARIALLSVIALTMTACGSRARVPVQPPALPSADIASFLFGSLGNNIGGNTTVTDSIDATGRITRKTYTVGLLQTIPGPWTGQEIETWSIYQRDDVAGCVRAVAEEGHLHATGQFIGAQEYDTQPCWVSGKTIAAGQAAIVTVINEAPYSWYQMDTTGGKTNQAKGVWGDKTSLTFDGRQMNLVEDYQDLSTGATSAPYCGLSLYLSQPPGMKSVVQQPSACL